MTQHLPRVVFCTATGNIIDYVREGAGETDEAAVARLTKEYGTALSAMPAYEAQDLYEARFKSPIEEITAERFDDGLNVLPPCAWTRARGAESFKISERIAGSVTAIYAAMGGRYFRFQDSIRMPHTDICERVAAFIADNPATAPQETKQ